MPVSEFPEIRKFTLGLFNFHFRLVFYYLDAVLFRQGKEFGTHRLEERLVVF